MTRLVLASASPARLRTLRSAGLDPEVVVSGVDEDGVAADTVPDLTARLAQLKAEAVATTLDRDHGQDHGQPTMIILGCDSLLELDGRAHGKPASAAEARERWQRMSGRSGVLHTGHHVLVRRGGTEHVRAAVASTTVQFATLRPEEIDAYVASSEPLQVAGAFTLDGLGGAFVTKIDGDPHNVVGISLPLLRDLLGDLGIAWTSLWTPSDLRRTPGAAGVDPITHDNRPG